MNETHAWYALDLTTGYPKAQLAPGVIRRRGTVADVHLLEQLETVSPEEARGLIEAGNHLNLVLDGDRLLHCSFTFTRSMPSIAAEGGLLALPADTVCLEDGVTASAMRGTGIGPENLTFVVERLKAEDVRWVVVKIQLKNRSSQRLIQKGGFEEVAVLRYRRLGVRARARIEPVKGAELHRLAEQLGAGLQRPNGGPGSQQASRVIGLGPRKAESG